MHDLESRVGLARAGGHDEQDAPPPFGYRLDGAVHGDALVVARRVAAMLVVAGHRDGVAPLLRTPRSPRPRPALVVGGDTDLRKSPWPPQTSAPETPAPGTTPSAPC